MQNFIHKIFLLVSLSYRREKTEYVSTETDKTLNDYTRTFYWHNNLLNLLNSFAFSEKSNRF